jgi:MFS-type transporter involved in bile tolerance (Atg22 family)
MDSQLKFLLFVVLVRSPTSREKDHQLKTILGSFLPVTLEQLARERGVLWSDKTTSCMAKKAAEEGARLLARAAEEDNNQCRVNVLGAEITTSSFAMYTFSIAVFVQALALVSFSSVADHGELLVHFKTITKLINFR